MALPPLLAGLMAATGLAASASILLYYSAHWAVPLELRKARIFLGFRRYERSYIAIGFLMVAVMLLVAAALWAAPDSVSDVPDALFIIVLVVPLVLGTFYSYFAGKGMQPPMAKFLRALRK